MPTTKCCLCHEPATKLQPIKGEDPKPYCNYHWRLAYDPTFLGFEGHGDPIKVLADGGHVVVHDLVPDPGYGKFSNPERARERHPAAMALSDIEPRLELGMDHAITWEGWQGMILGCHIHHPRVLATKITDMPEAGRIGGAAALSQNIGDPCVMFILLDTQAFWDKTQGDYAVAALPRVIGWKPLSLGAVLTCQCGDRGAIIDGQWQDARVATGIITTSA